MGANYKYSPQAKVDLEENVTVTEGSSYTFTMFTGETPSWNNTYQWYNAWNQAIPDATSRTYTIENVTVTIIIYMKFIQ